MIYKRLFQKIGSSIDPTEDSSSFWLISVPLLIHKIDSFVNDDWQSLRHDIDIDDDVLKSDQTWARKSLKPLPMLSRAVHLQITMMKSIQIELYDLEF